VIAGIQPSAISRDAAMATYVTNVAWAAELAGKANVRLTLKRSTRAASPAFSCGRRSRARR